MITVYILYVHLNKNLMIFPLLFEVSILFSFGFYIAAPLAGLAYVIQWITNRWLPFLSCLMVVYWILAASLFFWIANDVVRWIAGTL